jgi:hypothetical protein
MINCANQIFTITICSLFLRCSDKQDYVITEKDIIPEGVAYNSNSNITYIGSIYRQKIIGVSSKGEIEDVITYEHFGDLSPIGMEMDNDRNLLWVNVALSPIANQTNKNYWKTGVMSFDMGTNRSVKKYYLNKNDNAFLNDITVDKDGNVYATETVEGRIYKIDKATDSLEILLELKDYHFPNGITYYEPQNCLFVATNEGIIKIDLTIINATLIETENNINATVIDGLSVHNNYFIGHQSSKVSKFYFNDNISKIINVEILDTGKDFDSSTTGEIGNGYYYFIVNSQIRSGIDQKSNVIKPLDSLENVIIRKIKL